MSPKISLKRLPGEYGVCRLDPTSAIPSWADGEGFVSIGRSDEELSIVCLQTRVPGGVRHEGDWACFRFVGPFAFDETGIVNAVIGPLSEAVIGIFIVSTFDGDHLLIRRRDLTRAEPVLRAAGHVLL